MNRGASAPFFMPGESRTSTATSQGQERDDIDIWESCTNARNCSPYTERASAEYVGSLHASHYAASKPCKLGRDAVISSQAKLKPCL